MHSIPYSEKGGEGLVGLFLNGGKNQTVPNGTNHARRRCTCPVPSWVWSLDCEPKTVLQPEIEISATVFTRVNSAMTPIYFQPPPNKYVLSPTKALPTTKALHTVKVRPSHREGLSRRIASYRIHGSRRQPSPCHEIFPP